MCMLYEYIRLFTPLLPQLSTIVIRLGPEGAPRMMFVNALVVARSIYKWEIWVLFHQIIAFFSKALRSSTKHTLYTNGELLRPS